jgi:hypothetical protein
MPDMDIEHLSPGLGQPWPAHFISVCVRGGRGTRCRVQNVGSSRDRHVRPGHAPHGRVGPLAYRLWVGRKTARPPWPLSVYAREGLCWRLKCQAERVLEILLDFGAAGEASSERKS